MSISADAYARQLKQLLPGGALWKVEAGSWLSKFLLAISDELSRIDGRADDLMDEWDPRTASETLDDWERTLGGTPADGASDAERQAAIVAQMVARGGQSAAYYIAIATALGFAATVTEMAPHVWRLNLSGAGDVTELERVILRTKPAHTCAVFEYTDKPQATWGQAGLTWGQFMWGGHR